MRRRSRATPCFDLMSAIWQGEASQVALLSERGQFAMQLVQDLEMMEPFGGKEALDAAEEVEVQRMWLAKQARWDAEVEVTKRNMPKS